MQSEIELTSQTGVNVFQEILIEKVSEGRPISGVENEIVYVELAEDDERELGLAP